MGGVGRVLDDAGDDGEDVWDDEGVWAQSGPIGGRGRRGGGRGLGEEEELSSDRRRVEDCFFLRME